ncbi:hypothetical protein CVT26_000775 [Gymnopilus dilepis]|uniref:Uncharacterized protein n=1 Tax=Gymnopilus dilepis TaxID=231916 RepID=A0A409VHX9_9AGAR|nr:hypothetical protein CVT26_000775 [Gymnopilus dilepis]
MPPKLHVVEHNARLEQQMQNDISASLAAVIRKNPKLTTQEAMRSVTSEMLKNNPYQPPKDGRNPINDLPNEILAYIFQLGAEDEEEEEEEGEDSEADWEDVSTSEEESEGEESSSDESSVEDVVIRDDTGGQAYDSDSEDDEPKVPFQVLVSQVCRRWREVAVESPTLWTTLKFVGRPRLEKAKVYLSRAQNLPLTIYIDCTFPESVDEEDHPDHPLYSDNEARRQRRAQSCEDPDCSHDQDDDDIPKVEFISQQQLSQILDLIEPEVSHWQLFDFRASTYGYVSLLLSRLHKLPSAPLLETLQICHFEDCEDFEFFSGDDKTSFLPFHGIAPNLRDAVFWGVHIQWDGPLLRNLQNLELSYHSKDVRPSYKAFVDIINSSPDLHTLILSLSGPALPEGVPFDADPEEHEGAWGPTPLTIPSLQELGLQFHDVQYASALVQHLDTPNLKSLLLNFEGEDYSSFVKTLVKPVKGRAESVLHYIENLKLSGLPCDMASAEAFLGQLVNLKSLNIKIMGHEEALIFQKLIDPKAAPDPMSAASFTGDSPLTPLVAAPASTQAPLPPSSSSENTSKSKASEAFCPKLETLTTNEVEFDEIKALILKRKEIGIPIKSLFVSQLDGITKKEEKWLRENLEELEFFEPSDSDEDFEDEDIEIVLDDDPWIQGTGLSEDSESEGDEEDMTVDETGEPLISPLARHLRRGRGRGPTGNHDLD